MKKLLLVSFFLLMLTGCVAVPVYDSGYYHPYYSPYPYPYVYAGPEVSVYVPIFRGNHGYYGDYGDYGDYGLRGGHGFRGGRR